MPNKPGGVEISLKPLCLKGSFQVMGHEVKSREDVGVNRRIMEIMWFMATRYIPKQYGEIGELAIRLAKMMAYFPILEDSDSTIELNIRARTDFPGDEFEDIIQILELLVRLKLLKVEKNVKMVRGNWKGKIHFHSNILMEVIHQRTQHEKIEEKSLKDSLKFCKLTREHYHRIWTRAINYPELVKTHHQPWVFLKHCIKIEESKTVPIGHKALLKSILSLYKKQYGELNEFTMAVKVFILNLELKDPNLNLSTKWKKWKEEFRPELEEFVKISEQQYLSVLHCRDIALIEYKWQLVFLPFKRTFLIMKNIGSGLTVESKFYNEGLRSSEILRVFHKL